MRRSRNCAASTTPPHSWGGGARRAPEGPPLSRQDYGLHGPPAVPGGDRPVRTEFLALGHQGLRRDDLPLPVDKGPAFAHAVVVDRPHIESPELKDQEHLRGPGPDASHLHEPSLEIVVRKR